MLTAHCQAMTLSIESTSANNRLVFRDCSVSMIRKSNLRWER